MDNRNDGLTDDSFTELAKALHLMATDSEQKKDAESYARTILSPFYARRDKIQLNMYQTGESPTFSFM